MPTAVSGALRLVRQFRDATQREPGNLRAEALQRIGLAHQFVLLEAWTDQGSADTHGKAPTTAQFRDKIKTMQNAPSTSGCIFRCRLHPFQPSLPGRPLRP